VIRTSEHEVVQFDGPVLELVTDSRTGFDRRLAALGPDLLADEFDERAVLKRLREDDPTRGIGDALLDQRNVAGIGNAWKAEVLFHAGLDPWRRLAQVSDDEILGTLAIAHERMRESVERPGKLESWVYRRSGLPCRRCGTRVRGRGQGDDNRTTYWCPSCQA
jgi:endonuclease-8